MNSGALYKDYIGKEVRKKSGKPFKSKRKINIVKGVTINEQDPKNRWAFIFHEDDSIVNIDLCEPV